MAQKIESLEVGFTDMAPTSVVELIENLYNDDEYTGDNAERFSALCKLATLDMLGKICLSLERIADAADAIRLEGIPRDDA